jgi:uncharacterized membrane protein YoaK (UPF0700 family)
MIAKLPRWVWGGGFVLAFIAGMINAVGFLGLSHQAVTHLTGTTTLLGIAAGKLNLSEGVHLGAIIGSFVAGAILSGVIIKDSTLKLGRRYGAVLVIESVLLFFAALLLEKNNASGDYLASCACGLQNAMVSTYSGAALRTSHVSGIFTDLGIIIGHFLRRVPVDILRFKLCTMVLSGFFAGAVGGAIAFPHFGYQTLCFPATFTGLAGLSYAIYSHRQKIASKQGSLPLSERKSKKMETGYDR